MPKTKQHFRPPDIKAVCLYAQLAREDVSRFKFLLESYDNLAYLTTLDRFRAVVSISTTPSRLKELHEVLQGIQEDVRLRIYDF
jgi:hypothetical protein